MENITLGSWLGKAPERYDQSSTGIIERFEFRKSLCDGWLSFLKALGRRIQRSNGLKHKRTCARDTTN
uniref:Uncharacterized protein n=1 Tax=Trichogramma kaykai TaxID=54128 RepID=A0ABD2X8W1_9HYME